MAGLILIIEDEVDLATTLEYSLVREGYQVRVAHTGKAGLEAARLEPLPDLVVLDLMLPDLPGTEVCRRLREHERTRELPVVMCTARGSELDRVVGFEVGADDYVVKPFSVRELLLRIGAVLRRAESSTEQKEAVVEFGCLKFARDAHRVWVDDLLVDLTALEFRLLTTLYDRKNRVQSRGTLLEDVWGMDSSITTRTVDTHVKRLREKLASARDYVETVRGVGYRFVGAPEEAATN